MLGTPSQMNDEWNRQEDAARLRHEVHMSVRKDLESEGKAIFFSRNGEKVEIDLMDLLDEMMDDETLATLATFWQKKSNGTALEAMTAVGKLFEKLDRTINDEVETFL